MQSTMTRAPRLRSGALSYLSLFTSVGTLLCCALPSLLVLFGLGATVASVLSEAPWLVALAFSVWFCFAFMADDDLGQDPGEEAGHA